MIKTKKRMMLGERVRELAYWSLDFLKGRPVRRYYDEIQQAWRESIAPDCVNIQMDKLFSHAVASVPFYQYLQNKKELCLQDFPVLDKKRFWKNMRNINRQFILRRKETE